MMSNDHSNSARWRGPLHLPPVKPRPPEDILATETLDVERKKFRFTLRKNDRGTFLRIDEDAGGRHNVIIVPGAGFEGFFDIVDKLTASEVNGK